MLFNSYQFIFVFFPIVLIFYFVLGRASRPAAIGWLTVASLAFYGVWNASFVWLLIASILFNYASGLAIMAARGRAQKALLAGAVTINLLTLGYYKYSGFMVANWADLTGVPAPVWDVVLPVGISFYTFTQIAFLADAYAGKVRQKGVIEYALFVTYFPHLIAGPILHHAEMISQFARDRTVKFNGDNLSIGLAVFLVGLTKKVLIADSLAPYADTVFAAKAPLCSVEAWLGVLAYTLQLYFDFSGYSDMAIGLSRMMNIDLPLNFYSPYKAQSIIEFWRRWHISLSRFLRDYLYIKLGGNRRGPSRRYINLMITMVLGGLWHGAAWTFVIWGLLHGLYLFINHAFRALRDKYNLPSVPGGAFASWALTFLCVVVAWVFFRAANLESAVRLLAAMAGLNGMLTATMASYLPWPIPGALWRLGLISANVAPSALGADLVPAIVWIGAGLAIALFFPNTQQIFSLPFVPGQHDGKEPMRAFPSDSMGRFANRLVWRPTLATAICYGVMGGVAILFLTRTTRFLYFQF